MTQGKEIIWKNGYKIIKENKNIKISTCQRQYNKQIDKDSKFLLHLQDGRDFIL